MNAIQKLIDRCNEMDITEQLNWLGDASMSYQAKVELARLQRIEMAAKKVSGSRGVDFIGWAMTSQERQDMLDELAGALVVASYQILLCAAIAPNANRWAASPRRRINVSEHNPNVWQDGFDAWQNGYDDAMYDGIDTSSEMPCKCKACLKAYDEGQEEAIKEIFGRGKSSQQTVAR